MFTVKHVATNGSESIMSVDSVSFDKERNCLIGYGPIKVEWTGGSAYVMNELGKTVGVYNLSMKLGTTEVTGEQAAQARKTAHESTQKQS